jgi:sugar lactone lactonase YvrE
MCSSWLPRIVSRTICVLIVLLPAVATAQVANFKPQEVDRIVPPDSPLVRAWSAGEFTEGPAPMANGNILFSDIGSRIMRFGPTSETTTVFRTSSGKANGLMFDPQGRLIACEGAGPGGRRRISITELDGKVRTLADSFEGKRFNSPNDLAITKTGNVYFTDPRYIGDEPRELDFEGVFLVEPNGTVKLATRDVEKPNGILVSADQSIVYVADNNSDPAGAHTLLAFDVGPDGTLENKRVLFDFGPNKRGIDGMTLDQQGNIYATAGSGSEGGVYVFDPQGAALAFIPIPGDPTNCVFGVGKWAKRLYITAAGPPPEPGRSQKFALYHCELQIPGYHVFPPAKP